VLRLAWGSRALRDVEAIIGYISDRNAPAAERLLGIIENAAEQLAAHPYLHRPGRVAGTREAVVHPNYLLIYRVGAETVEVLAVVHARQQYP
jgi:addiction module RelE/StbE family toxin